MVRLTFAGYRFDAARRELLHQGELVAMQPQVFDLLAYLIEHRDRVVGKDELLDALWPDSVVSEGSLQRNISLVRAALDRTPGDLIRTYPRRGYRFVAETSAEAAPLPPAALHALTAAFEAPPRYVRNGDAHLAWRELGVPRPDGPHGGLDIILLPDCAFPMGAWGELARTRSVCAELAGLGRLLLFDQRGVGQSDPAKSTPTMAERMNDVRSVLDAAGSRRALFVAIGSGGPLALFLAAADPARMAGLILVGSLARLSATADYPCGWSAERVDDLRRSIRAEWGAGSMVRAMAPRHASEPDVQRWASAVEQRGGSPGAVLDLVDMDLLVDARPLVPAVLVPSVVLHQRDDGVIPVGCGRYLADRLPRCRYVEVEGDDHAFLFDGTEVLLREVAAMAERARRDDVVERRFLATAMAARIDGDGDGVNGRSHREAIDAILRGFAGTVIAHDPGHLLASFDGPARAIRCAAAMRDALGARGRFAVHIGELARDGAIVRGPALDVAAAIAATAEPGDVRVSRLVAELIGTAEHGLSPDGEVESIAVFRIQPPPLYRRAP